MTAQARVLDSRNKRTEARQLAEQAVERSAAVGHRSRIRPFPYVGPTAARCIYLGFVQQNTNDEEAAVKTLEEARDAFRSIDGLKLDDLPSAAAYAEASAWEVNALQALGRAEETRRVGEDAIRVAGQVLEQRPGHMPALRARALLVDTLASAEMLDLHTRKGAGAGASRARATGKRSSCSIRATRSPGTISRQHDMTAGIRAVEPGADQRQSGAWRAALAVEPHAKAGRLHLFGAGDVGRLPRRCSKPMPATVQAAATTLAVNGRLIEIATRDLPVDSFARSMLPELLRYYGFPTTGIGFGAYALPLAARDYAEVRDTARASARRIEQLKPPGPQQELDRDRMLDVAYRTRPSRRTS